MPTGESGGAFATLTHARLRAAQGDVGGAVRILRVILNAQPDHPEARAFLAGLDDRVAITYRDPVRDHVTTAPPAAVADTTGRVREVPGGQRPPLRLSRWLERVRRNRGERRVR
jgi:hypothetical protein